MSDDTLPKRPTSDHLRPKTGLAAWELTIGYLAAHLNPNTLLTVRVTPNGDDLQWAASLEWNHEKEQVSAKASFGEALRELWQLVSSRHVVFRKNLDDYRKPIGYSEFDWIDADTKDAIERLTWVTQVVFKRNWTLVISYQALDNAEQRVQSRLIANNSAVHIGGRGASIQDAVSQLYRNATPYFSKEKD